MGFRVVVVVVEGDVEGCSCCCCKGLEMKVFVLVAAGVATGLEEEGKEESEVLTVAA